MKKKRKIQVVEIPILNAEYWVYVVMGKPNEVIKYMQKHFEDAYISLDEIQNYRGRTYHRLSYNPVIHMIIGPKNKHFHSTLAHEAIHAINYLWDAIGEKSHDEVFAHSVGAVVYEVDKFLKEKSRTAHLNSKEVK